MNEFTLSCSNISKSYIEHIFILKDINLSVSNGEVLLIRGRNGSGKTTLLKMLCRSMKPSSGKIEFILNNTLVTDENFFNYFGYVSPYLNLYEEFTPEEHAFVLQKIRCQPFDNKYFTELMERLGIYLHMNKPIRAFSSGMKQRFKFVLALLHHPVILFLDEPSTNLDSEGINNINLIIAEFKSENKAAILASNDEYQVYLADKILDIDNL